MTVVGDGPSPHRKEQRASRSCHTDTMFKAGSCIQPDDSISSS